MVAHARNDRMSWLPAFSGRSGYRTSLSGNSTMKLRSIALTAATLVVGMGMSSASLAVTQSRAAWTTAPSCQLSIPTVDTQLRARSTGFRNEGTTSAFVICQFATPNGTLNGASLYATPIDGVSRPVTCTAVNGFNLGPALNEIAYSTKTMGSLEISGIAAFFQWDASDFGGTAGDDLPNSGMFSVTCILPPKTQINMTNLSYEEDVGS
jgi:hypothetical protein